MAEKDVEERKKHKRSTPCCSKAWWTKYFCYGQHKKSYAQDPAAPQLPPAGHSKVWEIFWWNRPQLFGLFAPWSVIFLIWVIVMAAANLWWIFENPDLVPNGTGYPGYLATITMIFGSIVAGATSEGGGSIAFPVFTLILSPPLPPSEARDFSLAIQSVGMTAASFTIWYNQIDTSKDSLLWCNLGGAIGVLVGLAWIATPNMPAAYSKMVFVSVFFAFAINLFILNMQGKRKTYLQIPNPTVWTNLILLLTGIVGGILTSISGSGLDICSFSVLTLVFRVSEKIATPTSVILMATNAIVGFFYQASRGVISERAWIFFGSSVCVVPLGAPFGAFISSFLHRQVLACFVYFTDTAQFILACVIVNMDLGVILTTVFVTLASLGIFFLFRVAGSKRMEFVAKAEQEAASSDATLMEGWKATSVALV